MNGMDSTTGKRLTGINHLRQSIRDILTTPVGSRVMRRDYGSRIYELVDAPVNNATMVDIYAATAEAVLRWEPRFQLTRVQVENATPGKVTLRLQGKYQPTQEPVDLDGVEVA
jgi:phage baseplate assembly protein W